MKKILILCIAILGLLPMAFAQTTSGGPIPLRPGKPGSPPPIKQPRTLLPVSGNYAMNGVDLQFSADLGVAAVTVVNQTTGEQWFDLVDTASGTAHIDTTTSEVAGSYLIYIELEDGSTYWGEYVLI